MTPDTITATLLFTILPPLNGAALAAQMAGLHLDGQDDAGELQMHTAQATIDITQGAVPLGAHAFCGAIAPDTTAANRAALTGIVARHGAWVSLEITPLTGKTANADLLDLTYRLVRALVGLHSPLALHWGPTNRLVQRAGIEALETQDTPFELFLIPRDEIVGPRRTPALRIEGAHLWLGHDLHAQLGTLPREIVRRAAMAFVRAARASAAVVDGQSFTHAGQSFRIAHAPDAARIDLIPTAQTPLIVRPLPRGLRQAV